MSNKKFNRKKKCSCPIYCKYCGAKLKKDLIGHYCGTRNCNWEYGIDSCTDYEEVTKNNQSVIR